MGVSARLDIGALLLGEKSICTGGRKDREGLAEISSRSRMSPIRTERLQPDHATTKSEKSSRNCAIFNVSNSKVSKIGFRKDGLCCSPDLSVLGRRHSATDS
jgi:hypothetical protein